MKIFDMKLLKMVIQVNVKHRIRDMAIGKGMVKVGWWGVGRSTS